LGGRERANKKRGKNSKKNNKKKKNPDEKKYEEGDRRQIEESNIYGSKGEGERAEAPKRTSQT